MLTPHRDTRTNEKDHKLRVHRLIYAATSLCAERSPAQPLGLQAPPWRVHISWFQAASRHVGATHNGGKLCGGEAGRVGIICHHLRRDVARGCGSKVRVDAHSR